MFGKKSDEEKAAAKARRELQMAISTLGLTTGIGVNKEGTHLTCVGQQSVPIEGARVTVDRGEAAKRITLTRVAFTGIFALALKKDATQLFITVEGTDGSAFLIDIPASKEAAARKFALRFRGE